MDKQSFNYTYSAKEQDEILAIRKKYSIPDETEDKISQLRRLDAEVTRKASVTALVFGVVGALMMGLGMSLVMTDLGYAMGLVNTVSMLIGVAVGVVGIALVIVAYPIYNRILKKERKRIAPEIIRLTDELMK